ncbi:MAG TPA: FAD-binding protein, partial [Verrucomicrobiaceae bacterium]
IPIHPAAHYMIGGVDADEHGRTSLSGLYAVGEAGCSGLHGANRLGGNSLSDLLVFGQRAGEYAAKYAKENSAGQINNDQIDQIARETLSPFDRGGSGQGPFQVQFDLQEMMQDLVGIVRREDEMQKAVQGIAKLWERAKAAGASGNRDYNPGWHTALDLHPLLTVSEAVALSALERKESRGGHFRDDYPEKDPACAKFNVVSYRGEDGKMHIRREPVKPMPAELTAIIEENK